MAEIEDPIPALKEQLRLTILDELENLNPIVLAHTLGIDEARMSDLQHQRIERFSIARLIRLLARINRAVEMTVVPTGLIPYPRYGPARGERLPTSREWERHGLACWGRGGREGALARTGKDDGRVASSGKSVSDRTSHSHLDEKPAQEQPAKRTVIQTRMIRTYGPGHIYTFVTNPDGYEVEISFE